MEDKQRYTSRRRPSQYDAVSWDRRQYGVARRSGAAASAWCRRPWRARSNPVSRHLRTRYGRVRVRGGSRIAQGDGTPPFHECSWKDLYQDDLPRSRSASSTPGCVSRQCMTVVSLKRKYACGVKGSGGSQPSEPRQDPSILWNIQDEAEDLRSLWRTI